jgi:hypothetical protein
MKNSRRNIPDPISPQNPVIKKDIIEEDRVQNHLEEKTSVEDTLSPDKDQLKADQKRNKSFQGSNDQNLEDES